MHTIKIKFDYSYKILWEYDEKEIMNYKYLEFIEENKNILELENKIYDLYWDYIEFNSHEQAMWINEEQMKKDKYILLDLIKQLVNRLNEINDGSFVVEDLETPILNEL